MMAANEMPLETLKIDTGETAAAQVECDLCESIIRLELAPGMRLSEQEIATRMGVSRQPVREVLIALASRSWSRPAPTGTPSSCASPHGR